MEISRVMRKGPKLMPLYQKSMLKTTKNIRDFDRKRKHTMPTQCL